MRLPFASERDRKSEKVGESGALAGFCTAAVLAVVVVVVSMPLHCTGWGSLLRAEPRQGEPVTSAPTPGIDPTPVADTRERTHSHARNREGVCTAPFVCASGRPISPLLLRRRSRIGVMPARRFFTTYPTRLLLFPPFAAFFRLPLQLRNLSLDFAFAYIFGTSNIAFNYFNLKRSSLFKRWEHSRI